MTSFFPGEIHKVGLFHERDKKSRKGENRLKLPKEHVCNSYQHVHDKSPIGSAKQGLLPKHFFSSNSPMPISPIFIGDR